VIVAGMEGALLSSGSRSRSAPKRRVRSLPRKLATMTHARVALYGKWALRHWLPRLYLRPLAADGDPYARLWFDPRSRTELDAMHDEFRSATGIVKSRGGCVITSHRVACEVLSKPNDFQHLDHTLMLPQRFRPFYRWATAHSYADPFEKPSMVAMEGSRLVEARKVLRQRLSGAALVELRERVEDSADRLCREMQTVPGKAVDVVQAYGRRLPAEVLAIVFDVSTAELDDIRASAEEVSHLLDVGLPFAKVLKFSRAAKRLDQWTAEQLASAEDHPCSVIAPAVSAMRDGKFSIEEVRRMVNLLLVAGYATSVSMLSSGTKLLIENQDQLALLLRTPNLWPNAVDEILRLAGPVMMVPRATTRENQCGGVPVKAGRPVYISGANRDPETFENPDRFDVTRANAAAHLAFGGGTHLCLGAPLARLELEIGLKTFFTTYPRAQVVDHERSEAQLVRSWNRLLVRLT
jgi:cytochrome P450